MNIQNLLPEIQWRSSRAGGKGGQNVNKVETAVEALWKVADTTQFSQTEKALLLQNLAGKLNKDGQLSVRAANRRSQLENKALALEKLEKIIEKALFVPKTRKAAKPSRAAKEKRLEAKKINAFRKALRRKHDV